MAAIGLTLDRTTNFLSGEKLVELVRTIERLGFESVWLLDAFGRDPFIAAGYILANTTTLKVGTGVATVYGRDPTAAVQARESLSEMYPGRFFMGLGASNPIVIAKRKAQWIAPLPKLRAYLQDMEEVRLAAIKPPVLAPIYIAAHGPALQTLAVKHAKGIITWLMPAKIVAEARAHVGENLDITAEILCVLSSDAEEARIVARTYMAMYLALPYYQAAFARAGFDPKECLEGGGSDQLIDSVLAWGSPLTIRERIKEFQDAGASRVVLNPLRIDSTQQGINGGPSVIGDWNGLQQLAKAVF